MKQHHLYVTFVCGGSFGAMGLQVPKPPQTIPEVAGMAELIRQELGRGRRDQLPPVVVLNWREMAPPSPIIPA